MKFAGACPPSDPELMFSKNVPVKTFFSSSFIPAICFEMFELSFNATDLSRAYGRLRVLVDMFIDPL